MSALKSLFAFSILALLVSGCSVNPATGKQSFTGFMSSGEEQKVGRENHPKILKQYGGAYTFKTLDTYINDLGQRLARVSEMPDLQWTFTILDDPVINAFALPGGYIYLSRGLISLAENEAELAAVLGHEIGHVTARHSAQRYSQGVVTNIGTTVLGAVFGRAAAQVANLGSQAFLAGYSREHEMEADALGIRYMTKLGYDPKAASSFFKKLAAHTALQAKLSGEENQQSHYGIFASHPDTQKRITATRDLAASYPASLTQKNRPIFLSQVAGLDFGSSRKQGFTQGHTFIHPDLRIQYTVPDGFRFDNQPDKVLATHDNGSVILFKVARNDYGDLSMTRFIRDVWAKKYTLRDLEALTIDSLPAAIGESRVRLEGDVRSMRFLAVDGGAYIYQFQILTPTTVSTAFIEDLQRMSYSVKQLTPSQAQAIQNPRLALHEVGQGDTLATLARRMKVPREQSKWLEVLNQETLRDGLQAGEVVKLVAQ